MTDSQEVETIVRRYRALGAQAASIEDERGLLRRRFEALVPLGYTLEVDGKPASKSAPARSFDLDTALMLAQVAGIAVRQVLTPDVSDLRDRLKAVGKLEDAMLPGRGGARVVLG